jgi:hypothetical protein
LHYKENFIRLFFCFIDLYKDTPLIVRDEENIDEKNNKITFNFITEIFFMSHLSYTCSVQRLHRMLLKVTLIKKNN